MSFEYTTPAIDRWKLDDFMRIVDDFEDGFADTVHRKVCVSNNYQTILFHIVGKSIITAREILTLCAHGYPDGALSLGRNLYEQMMIAFFFEIHKDDADFQDYVDDFFLSYEIQRNRHLRDINRYVSEDNVDDLQAEWESLKKQTKRKVKGDYWWTGHFSFSDVVKHIIENQTDESLRSFLGVHYMRYKRSCISLHAGCMGNLNRLGSNHGGNIVDTSPTICGQSTPLAYAAISLIAIIGIACKTYQIDSTKYLKPLNELATYFQNQEKEDLNSYA